MNLTDMVHRYAEQAASFVGERLGSIIRHAAEFLFQLGVTIVAMFYLFRDGDSVLARLRDVLPFEARGSRSNAGRRAQHDLRERHLESGVCGRACRVGRRWHLRSRGCRRPFSGA